MAVKGLGEGDRWSGRTMPASDEAVLAGVDRRLGAVGGAGLVEDVADVAAHGVAADNERVGDLLVGLACCQASSAT